MPIYEFFCPKCNTRYKFLSRSVNSDKKPCCPDCRQDILERLVSLFSTPSGGKETEDSMENHAVDESKMEQAMEKIAGDMASIKEEDPRQAARLMQKFSDLAGLKYTDSIAEALSRMEAGDDPEAIESEMGDAFSDENPFILPGKKRGTTMGPLRYDDTLYDM